MVGKTRDFFILKNQNKTTHENFARLPAIKQLRNCETAEAKYRLLARGRGHFENLGQDRNNMQHTVLI